MFISDRKNSDSVLLVINCITYYAKPKKCHHNLLNSYTLHHAYLSISPPVDP